MDFKISDGKIRLENNQGQSVAYVTFPEFEPGKVEVTHTVVNPELQGQGIAGKLMLELVKHLRQTGKRAELTCSYAIRWFARHEDSRDVLISPEAEALKAEALTGNACGLPQH